MASFFSNCLRVVKILFKCDKLLSSFSILLNLAAGVFPVALIYLNKLILDSVFAILVKPDGGEYILHAVWLVALLNGLILLHNLLGGFQGTLQTLLGAKLQRHMTEKTFDKVYTTDLKYFENPEFYDKLSRASSEAGYRPMIIVQLLVSLVQGFLVFATLFVILFGISRLLVLVLALSVIPTLIMEKRMRRLSFDTYQQKTQASRKMGYIGFLFTGVSSVRELKIFRLGEYLKAEYRRHFQENYKLDKSLAWKHNAVSFLSAAADFASSVYAYIFALLGVLVKRFGIGDFSFVIQSYGQCQAQIQGIINSVYSLYENHLFINNYFEFQALPSDIEADGGKILLKGSRGGRKWVALPERIETLGFDSVSFNYPGFERNVLKDLSFELKAGEITALLGDNGAGKTTIMKLLCRFYDPVAGVVLLNGRDIRSFELAEYRRRIGIVFQDFMRYYFTVGENIAFGAPWLMDGNAKKASIDSYLKGAGAVKDTRSRKKVRHPEGNFEGIQEKEPLTTRHSEASSRRETPEESVLNYNEDVQNPSDFRSRPFEVAPGMTHLYVESAARASGADKFIERLPAGYENILGRLFDGGAEISYGEWQKLGLSRALFGEKDILLLDEPFSHQYHSVLNQFFEYITGIKQDRICLVITHDPAVAGRTDRVIDLNATRPA